MMSAEVFTPGTPDPAMQGVIRLAIMAVGGQGGGVLTGWVEDLARACGYDCQATSVAGVAQRTGATIYYIEMAPRADGPPPVFSLAPAAGDVDILVAAEMMEAGRAILRGFVTPDRTTLIASTHRALAVSEKIVPGDGIASSEEVKAAAEVAARRLILADFQSLAVAQGSVISASLFGALCASGTLPFPRAAFEAAIRASGKGVEPSLRAFAAGHDAAGGTAAAPILKPKAPPATVAPSLPPAFAAGWEALLARTGPWPAPVRDMARRGLRKVVDFQDLAYGKAYLDRVQGFLEHDREERDHLFTVELAKHLANAMAYDDIIRVADLKTRPARFARIRGEMGVEGDRLLHLTEYVHPRAEEIAGMLPERLGARLEANRVWMGRIDRWFCRGRHLRSDGLFAFLLFWTLGGLRGWRLRTLRHAREVAHREAWLTRAAQVFDRDYDLAVEILRTRRLVKGYSDTHARGLSKFDRVMEGIALVTGRPDAADWARRLREAALKDEEGKALAGALATIRSFI